jgi:hypothetical protein
MKLRQFFVEDRKDRLRGRLLGQEMLPALTLIGDELEAIGQDSSYRRSLTSHHQLDCVTLLPALERGGRVVRQAKVLTPQQPVPST